MRKRAANPTLRPTPADVAWTAGFVEGEGCFQIHSTRSPAVIVVQKDLEPLERLMAFYGGFLHFRPKPALWAWQVSGLRAITLMEDIYPLMSTRRREKIDEVLLASAGCRFHRVEVRAPENVG